MKHSSSLTLLGLCLTPSLILAQTKSGGAPAEEAQEVRPALTLLEKNKLAKEAKGGKDKGGPKPGLEIRVVGGQQVTQASKYPFFVEWEDAKCGGSLVHEDIVLSAAHCENKNHPFNSRVFVNGLTTAGGVFRTVTQQMSHPMYKVNDNNDYDFMLLKLDSSALVDSNGDDTGCETVDLNTERSVPAVDDPLMAVGFGLTAEGGSETSEVLNDVEVLYVDDDTCTGQYGADTFNSDLMFCAGVEGGGKDTCQGDSGGPIILPDSNVQVGVVSYGIGCARANYNGVYARVSSVTEWIEEQICALSANPPPGCPPQEDDNGGIGAGNGKLKISVKYDNYANEFGFSLVHDESEQRLHFHPFSFEDARNKATAWWSWSDLPAGDYTLYVGDQGRDGYCCGYGNGYLSLIDQNNNNREVWKVSEFGEFVAGKFTIDDNGDVTFNGESTEYDNSWEASATPPNYPQVNDQSWPGPKPTAKGALNINIRMDRYPQEVSYTLKKLNSNGNGWSTIDSFDGAEDGVENDLVSFQLEDLAEGWYELAFEDTGNDGICCDYRYGWLAVTGHLKATRRSGLVWGDNGEFGGDVTVYLQVDSKGYFTQISYVSPI